MVCRQGRRLQRRRCDGCRRGHRFVLWASRLRDSDGVRCRGGAPPESVTIMGRRLAKPGYFASSFLAGCAFAAISRCAPEADATCLNPREGFLFLEPGLQGPRLNAISFAINESPTEPLEIVVGTPQAWEPASLASVDVAGAGSVGQPDTIVGAATSFSVEADPWFATFETGTLEPELGMDGGGGDADGEGCQCRGTGEDPRGGWPLAFGVLTLALRRRRGRRARSTPAPRPARR